MCCQPLRAGAFLTVLSLALAAMTARGDEPPKKSAQVADNPFGDSEPAPAVPGKYRKLLRTIAVQDDRQTYGDFYDFGFWSGGEYKGIRDLPAGYWVYVAPNWYIFGEMAGAQPAAAASQAPTTDDEDPFGKSAAPAPAKPAAPTAVAKVESPPKETPKPAKRPKLHGGEKAILQALKKQASISFVETPLKDVLDSLSSKYHIPIRFDPSGLKDAGVDENTPVTCDVSGVPLQSALEIMLDELQLKWTIHHEVLMITSPTKAESDDYIYTKFYDVTDLVVPPRDDTIRHNPLTTPDALGNSTQAPTPMGMFGSGPVGMGGTGPFVVGSDTHRPIPSGMAAGVGAPAAAGNARMIFPQDVSLPDFTLLRDAITNTVAQKTWLDNGGVGSMSECPPHSLAISQTREVHQQVEKFISDLRKQRLSAPTISVELHWLWLDAAHRDVLLPEKTNGSEGAAQAIDLKRFLQVAQEVPHFHAQTACISGMRTALAAGDRRALIISGIPVVDESTAYSPVISMPNVGLTAEVCPTFVPGTKSVMLNVRSTLSRWDPASRTATLGTAWPAGSRTSVDASHPAVALSASAPPPAAGNTQPSTANANSTAATTFRASQATRGAGSASCPIDLPVMPTQEFGATIRVPLGRPMLVGSAPFAPAGNAGLSTAEKDPVEVYLIATTTLVKRPKR